MSDPRLNSLISRVIDQTATREETELLDELLNLNPEAQTRYVQAVELHFNLESLGSAGSMESPQSPVLTPKNWKRWISTTSMAAGICVGLFAASLLQGYVQPRLQKNWVLFTENFESGPAPIASGVPQEPDHWSGDETRRTGSGPRVSPLNGRSMLQLVSADYQGKNAAAPSRTSSIWKLIDLRPYKSLCATGNFGVHLSAHFNAEPFEDPLQYMAYVSIHALDSEAVRNGTLKDWKKLDSKALALNRGNRTVLDRDPRTWQRLNASLALPSPTDFLLLEIALKQTPPPDVPIQFGTQSIDGIRLILGRNSRLD